MNQPMVVADTRHIDCILRSVISQESDKTLADKLGIEIAIQALQRLQSSPHHELRTLRCEVRDQVVVIRGKVSSYYLKQLAQESIRSIAIDHRIDNCLVLDWKHESKCDPANVTNSNK